MKVDKLFGDSISPPGLFNDCKVTRCGNILEVSYQTLATFGDDDKYIVFDSAMFNDIFATGSADALGPCARESLVGSRMIRFKRCRNRIMAGIRDRTQKQKLIA